jgi:anti-sigma regulatory factor (Ser/Thr protein kinase)
MADQWSGMTMHVAIVADTFAPTAVRQRLRAWLGQLRWPAEETDDLVLAVNEAVANVVDHAYPPHRFGLVHVSAQHRHPDHHGRRITVTVSDHGTWRPIPLNPGNRGRGLPIMRAITHTLHIDTTATGTTVTLTSKPVPT